MPVPHGFAAITIPFRHTLVARPATLTFGVEMPPDPTGLGAAADAVWAAWTATGSLNAQMDSEVTVGPLEARRGGMPNPAGGEFEEESHTTTTPVQGGRASASTYAGVAVLVRKNTAYVGKRAKGRMFLPWVIGYSNINEAGTIHSSVVTPLQTACNTFLTNLNTAGYAMHVLHADPTIGPYRVLSLTVDPLLSSQRRRYNRGG